MAKKTLDVTFKLTDQFTAPMRRITNGFRRLQRRSMDSLKRMGVGFKNLLKSVVSLRGAIVGLVAIWGVRRFWGALRETADYIDDIQKLGIQTGETTEFLSEMRFVLEQSGNSWAGFQVALRRGARNLEDATSGIGAGYEAFQRLGISVRTETGELLKMSELLPIVAQKFESLGDETLKASLAADIFGRSGAEMLRFLNFGSQEIERLREQAQLLGVTIGKEAADNAAAFKDALNALGHAIRSVWRRAINEVLPSMTQAFKDATAAIAARRDALVDGLELLMKTVSWFVRVSSRFFVLWVATVEAAMYLGRASLNDFRISVLQVIKELTESGTALNSFLSDILPKKWYEEMMFYNEGVTLTIQEMAFEFESTAEAMQFFHDRVQQALDDTDKMAAALDKLVNPFRRDPKAFVLTLDEMTDGIHALKQELSDAIKMWSRWEEAGRATGREIVDAMTSFTDLLADSMIDGFENFKESAKEILADLGREITRILVRLALFRLLGSFFNTPAFTPQFPGQAAPVSNRGNVFEPNARGGIEANQQGGIYRVPGLFRSTVNQGIGSIAERGPEAILPLFRRNGILGVASQGGGVTQNVTINAAGMDRQELLDALRMHGTELTRTVNHTYRQHSGLRGEARQVVGA